MANESVTLQGKAKYTRLVTLNKYGKWSVRLYFDKPSLEKFKNMQVDYGIKTVLHKDDNNDFYADLSRPPHKDYKTRDGGSKRITFTPPIVTERDGMTPFVGNIGDGSDISVEMEIYQYTIPGTGKKAKAARLHAVRVDNLVPWVPQTGLTPSDLEQVSNLNKTPPQPQF